MILPVLLACASTDSAGGFTASEDTSYPGNPVLEAVSASCDGSIVSVRARTKGWTSLAVFDAWDTTLDPQLHEHATMPTVAFRRDEYCDLVEYRENAADAVTPDASLPTGVLGCGALQAGRVTFLVQAWYEEGCAGGHAFGGDPAAVYADTMSVTVPPTVAAGDVLCAPANAGEDVGVVLDEVPPCAEPL